MLDVLLGRGFASKCKPLIKLTKTRIVVVQRKRKATEKFLKKDIADLLANGLDINAYQRRECPEDYREAVSSLMFAAARFSELSELRELRQIFQERYGNSLELYVNQEFVENAASKPSTLEKKVQLMQDVVLEYSITWDSEAFEKRMSRPFTCVQDQPTNYGSFNVTINNNEPYSGMGTIPRGEQLDVSSKERLELTNDGRGLCNGLEGAISKEELDIQSTNELSGKGYKVLNCIKRTILKKDGHDILYQGRQEVANDNHDAWNLMGDATQKPGRSVTSSRKKRLAVIDGRSRLLTGRENTYPANNCRGSSFHGKPYIYPSFAGQQSKGNGKEPFAGKNYAAQHDFTKSVKKLEKDLKMHNAKPHYHNVTPPYVKPNLKAKASKSGPNLGSSMAGFGSSAAVIDPSMRKRGKAGNTSERIQVSSDNSVHQRQVVGTASLNGHGQEKDHLYQDNLTGNSSSKLRSDRSSHVKSHTDHNNSGYFEDTELFARKARSKGRDKSRRGLQTLFDDEHYQNKEEERILDKLLMQYSKKPSPYELSRVSKSKNSRAHKMSTDVRESPQNGEEVSDDKPEAVPPPLRSVSLPREHTGQSKVTKTLSRAASFQPDRSSLARHVHPKLPDYDDLAAKFAALRGK